MSDVIRNVRPPAKGKDTGRRRSRTFTVDAVVEEVLAASDNASAYLNSLVLADLEAQASHIAWQAEVDRLTALGLKSDPERVAALVEAINR